MCAAGVARKRAVVALTTDRNQATTTSVTRARACVRSHAAAAAAAAAHSSCLSCSVLVVRATRVAAVGWRREATQQRRSNATATPKQRSNAATRARSAQTHIHPCVCAHIHMHACTYMHSGCVAGRGGARRGGAIRLQRDFLNKTCAQTQMTTLILLGAAAIALAKNLGVTVCWCALRARAPSLLTVAALSCRRNNRSCRFHSRCSRERQRRAR